MYLSLRFIKDGPSAGMAFAVCLISLFSDRRVPPLLAMTGELSLRGKVTAVGKLRNNIFLPVFFVVDPYEHTTNLQLMTGVS